MTILLEDPTVVGEARARSALYSLLAWGWRYPDEETVTTLRALRQRCDDPEILGGLDENTRNALELFARRLDNLEHRGEGLRQRYAELFGHAVRGACPLYELEYGQAEIVQQASELSDIAGFFTAFGLQSAETTAERVDHVAVECEFMCVLCAKYAAGSLSRSTELTDSCFDAQRSFLRDHLARWLPALCSRVSKADGEGTYGALARLAAAFVEWECHTFGIQAGPDYIELRAADSQADREIQCGPAAGQQLVPLTIGGSVAEEP